MMPIRALLVFLCFSTVALIDQGPRRAFGQFNDLLKRIPGPANAIVLIDADALYSSPMALKNKWKEKFATNWNNQPIIVPPEAKRIALASHLDPLNQLKSDWECGVMELSEPLAMNSIARAEGGYVDSIDGTSVVWTPSRAYFIQLDKQLLGIVYPDDRQATSRWINRNRTGQMAPLSPYLEAASKRLRVDGQIVMAIDLENVVQPHLLENSLNESKLFEDKKPMIRSVATAFATLKGVTLSVKFESRPMATARIDFGQNMEFVRPFAKDLVLEAMDRFGARVEDPKAWKAKVENKTIILSGLLSDSGLSRVSSLLELPTSKFSTLAKESEKKDDSPKAIGQASKRYFDSLEKLVADLREGMKVPGTSTMWLGKSARKIDGMPILHVDDELLGFGSWVSKTFREMEEGVRGVARQQSVTNSYGNYYAVGSYGNTGYYGGDQTHVVGEQSHAAASSVRTKGMQAVENGLADMRRKMTKKYSVEF